MYLSDDLSDLPGGKPKIGGGIMVDGKLVAESYQCVHCSGHWYPQKGSGIKRGYCRTCKGLVCGQPNCMGRCIPLEARLQGWEGNKTKDEVLRELDSQGRTIGL